jgi:protein O-mannosyl-transferase
MKKWWIAVAWLAAAGAPWLGGLWHPFLYDDVGMIERNDFLADGANVWRVLSGDTLADPGVVNGRRPAVLATYFMDRAVHGLRPQGYRLTSLALHLGCAALAAALWRRLGATGFVAGAAGLLHALHPALVEAVHAPGFRADVLCLFFMLAGLHGFAWMRRRPAAGLALGLGGTVLALLSKETALALPLALGAAMGLFPRAFPASGRLRGAAWAGCAAVAAAFFGLWLATAPALQAAGGSWNGESLRFPETVFSAPALWTHALRGLAAPWPPQVAATFEPVRSAASLRFWAGLGLMGVWGWAAWRRRRSDPLLALGLAWTAAFFVPVSNLLPLFHPVAERYLAPMAPGFALAAACGLDRLRTGWRGAALAGLAVAQTGLVLARVAEWSSADRLWTKAHERSPTSADAATWLGLVREEQGDWAAARSLYAAATAANPRADRAWINWGILEGRAGRLAESERLLRKAAEVRPENASAWRNLAACLERQGRGAEAAAALARAEAVEALARAEAVEASQGRLKP